MKSKVKHNQQPTIEPLVYQEGDYRFHEYNEKGIARFIAHSLMGIPAYLMLPEEGSKAQAEAHQEMFDNLMGRRRGKT